VTENLADCEHDDGDHSDEADGPCPDDAARGRRASPAVPGIWACGWMRSLISGWQAGARSMAAARGSTPRYCSVSALCSVRVIVAALAGRPGGRVIRSMCWQSRRGHRRGLPRGSGNRGGRRRRVGRGQRSR